MDSMSLRNRIRIVLLAVVAVFAGTALHAQVDTIDVPDKYMQQSLQDLMAQGNELFEKQQYREARPYYLAVIKKDTTQAGAFSRLSEIEYSLYDLSTAQRYLREALEEDPGNQQYRARFQNISKLIEQMQDGIDAQSNREYEVAMKQFNGVLQSYPNFAPALYHKGLIYRSQSQPDSAASYFRRAIEASPTEKRYQVALENLAKMHFKDGIEAFRRGNLSGAEQSFETTVSIDSTFKQSLYMLGVISRRRGNVQNAIDYYKQALSIDENYAQAWFALGIAYKSTARGSQALEAFTQAAKINPNYTKAHNERGLILTEQENYQAAAQAFQQAIQTNPQYAAAYEGLGIVYQRQGKFQQAANQFTTAVKFDQDNASLYYRLSEVYHELSNYQQQQDYAQQSLELKPNYAPALVMLGDAECHLGNLEAARQAWNKAKADAQWRAVAEHRMEILEKTGQCE